MKILEKWVNWCSGETHALQVQTMDCTSLKKILKIVTTKGFDSLGGRLQAQKVSGSNSHLKIQENYSKNWKKLSSHAF